MSGDRIETTYLCARNSGEPCRDRRSTDMSNDELRKIIKEAQIEGVEAWLDKKFAQFGKWSFYGIAAAAFIFLVKFLIKTNQI